MPQLPNTGAFADTYLAFVAENILNERLGLFSLAENRYIQGHGWLERVVLCGPQFVVNRVGRRRKYRVQLCHQLLQPVVLVLQLLHLTDLV